MSDVGKTFDRALRNSSKLVAVAVPVEELERLRARLTQAEAECAVLRERLKPFAADAHLYKGCDDDERAEDVEFTVGQLRAAQDALSTSTLGSGLLKVL